MLTLSTLTDGNENVQPIPTRVAFPTRISLVSVSLAAPFDSPALDRTSENARVRLLSSRNRFVTCECRGKTRCESTAILQTKRRVYSATTVQCSTNCFSEMLSKRIESFPSLFLGVFRPLFIHVSGSLACSSAMQRNFYTASITSINAARGAPKAPPPHHEAAVRAPNRPCVSEHERVIG